MKIPERLVRAVKDKVFDTYCRTNCDAPWRDIALAAIRAYEREKANMRRDKR
jgi:hypothetical protein